MALTRKDYTISGLAVELRRDKRTIASIIDESNIDPVRKKGAYKYYHISDIVTAMLDSSGLDLQQEKALESRERRRKLKLENDEREGLTIVVDDVVEAFQVTAKMVLPILDNLTTNIKRNLPDVSAKQISFIEKDIAKCKNAIAATRLKN